MTKVAETKSSKKAAKPSISQPTVKADSTPLIPAEIKEKAAIQARKMKVIKTNSTCGKIQNRNTGTRSYRNIWGHYVGTIGAKLDNLIMNGNFTKHELVAIAGTKMSKVNSHIADLRKTVKVNILIDPVTRKVSVAG